MHRRHHRGLTTRVTALIAFLACLGTAAPAWADYHEDEAALGWMWTSSTTLGGIVTTAGGIVLTVYVATSNNRAMKSYIRHNAVALQQDLTLGAGPTVDDLAQAFGVPEAEVADFGQALRSKRSTLVPLIGDGDVDDARTARFVDLVESATSGEQRLAGTYRLALPTGS